MPTANEVTDNGRATRMSIARERGTKRGMEAAERHAGMPDGQPRPEFDAEAPFALDDVQHDDEVLQEFVDAADKAYDFTLSHRRAIEHLRRTAENDATADAAQRFTSDLRLDMQPATTKAALEQLARLHETYDKVLVHYTEKQAIVRDLDDQSGRVRRECAEQIQKAAKAKNEKAVSDSAAKELAGDAAPYVELRDALRDAREKAAFADALVKCAGERLTTARMIAAHVAQQELHDTRPFKLTAVD